MGPFFKSSRNIYSLTTHIVGFLCFCIPKIIISSFNNKRKSIKSNLLNWRLRCTEIGCRQNIFLKTP